MKINGKMQLSRLNHQHILVLIRTAGKNVQEIQNTLIIKIIHISLMGNHMHLPGTILGINRTM